MRHPALLSFACGFASLSLEILWVRLYGFTKSSTPAAFGFVLAAFLVGIALGASAGGRACKRLGEDDDALWRASLLALLVSALLSPLLPAAFAAAYASGRGHPLLDLGSIALAAAVLSFVFPIAHHLGTRHVRDGQGQRFARVYTANVAGAGLGPLVTGYLLLDTVTLQTAFVVVGALQAGAALVLLRGQPGATRRGIAAAGVALMVAGVVAVATLDRHALVQAVVLEGGPAKTVVENRHGIITILPGPGGDDLVYGGNVYDGRTNVDLDRNTNGLQRPLLAVALHPQPRRVLMVGLSIGSWLAVVRDFPGIETIDTIEINPGYLGAAQAYPAQAGALRDPRVHLVVDDARRWLRQHPERRYDVIIMNTTLHWRSNATLLLSQEMLRQLRGHMAPGAVLALNATSSHDAFHTAAQAFPHAYRYANFIYAADFDFRPRKDEARTHALFANLRVDGKPVFAPGSPNIRGYLALPFVTLAQDQAAHPRRPFEVVTDENMITEFRYGRPLYFGLDFLPF